MWFFGLLGSNILAPIINALFLPLLTANTDAFNLGKANADIPNIVSSQFLDSYVNLGGSGATICLIIAIFMVSRNKANKAIANLGLAPGLFNINEPVQFGLPMVLNPIYFIPFIFVPILFAIIGYVFTAIGIVPKIVLLAPWTTPPILGAIMSTSSIRGAIIPIVNIIVGTIIYIPFVKMADKRAEAEAEAVLSQSIEN